MDLKGVRSGVERRHGASGLGLKPRGDGRRDTPGDKVLKKRRAPRERGRMGTSVKCEKRAQVPLAHRPRERRELRVALRVGDDGRDRRAVDLSSRPGSTRRRFASPETTVRVRVVVVVVSSRPPLDGGASELIRRGAAARAAAAPGTDRLHDDPGARGGVGRRRRRRFVFQRRFVFRVNILDALALAQRRALPREQRRRGSLVLALEHRERDGVRRPRAVRRRRRRRRRRIQIQIRVRV